MFKVMKIEEVKVGDRFNGEEIHDVVNHPSGVALFGFGGLLIDARSYGELIGVDR